MTLLRLYVIGYFAVVAGASLALWQAGVLGRIPVAWTVTALLVAAALGIVLAITSTRPPVRLE